MKSKKERHYDFVQNRQCEYFPCHQGVDPEKFSCLFCYCPLYALRDQCGGNFEYLKNGIKSCEHCTIPHKRKNFDWINRRMPMILEIARKKPEEV